MTVRTSRIEIFGFGKASGDRDNWLHLSRQMQRMLNRMWQIWLVHHAGQNSAALLRKHLDDFAEWRKIKKGAKPKWPVQNCDKTLSNRIYHIISDEFPDVNARTRVLLQNKWQGTLSTRKAANGSLPGWVSILFGNESIPSFTRPQPIVFDKDNGRLEKIDGVHMLTVRIERLCGAEGKVKPSVVESCALMTNKRKAASMRTVIDRCISGEYSWKGSSLLFDRGKWFALLSYEMPKNDRKPLDIGKTMYVIPGKLTPWILMAISDDKRDAWRFGGGGKHVEYARRTILDERASRKEHYRWAGSAQKGSGRGRADAVWTKLSSRWKDFVKRYNHEVSRRIVNMCVMRGVGRIVYCQAKDSQRDRTYLAKAGNRQGSAMLWDFFQMGTLLAYKCEHEGIEYEKHETKARTDDDGSLSRVRKPNDKPSKTGGKRQAISV